MRLGRESQRFERGHVEHEVTWVKLELGAHRAYHLRGNAAKVRLAILNHGEPQAPALAKDM